MSELKPIDTTTYRSKTQNGEMMPTQNDELRVRSSLKRGDKKYQKLISCLDINQNIYGVNRPLDFVGVTYLKVEEAKAYLNGDKSLVEKIVRESLVPEGDYEVSIHGEIFDEVDRNKLVPFDTYKVIQPKFDFPYGVYTLVEVPRIGFCFKQHFLNNDNKLLVGDNRIVPVVKDFFEKGREGRSNRMGILAYGPPGNGKTTQVLQLINIAEELQVRVILIGSKTPLDALEQFRETLNGHRMVFIFEEMTERLQYGSVEQILTFLDGENSWTNCVNIATTNYPEQFPANLVDRPGRFEQFFLYDNPGVAAITELGAKYGFSEEQSKTLSGMGLSFDYVSYIFSIAKTDGLTPQEAKKKEEEKRSRLSQTFRGKLGF